jgi:ribosome-binding factor A
LVRTELASILHTGIIRGKGVTYLEDELRQRISIVSVDVSPDLRQARVSVSIRNPAKKNSNNNNDQAAAATAVAGSTGSVSPAVDKRRAYSWLVANTRPIRHTLAQRMSHIKTSPDLTFVQVDVSAAVDVMYLIDKVSKGYERERIGEYGGDDDSLPEGMVIESEVDDGFIVGQDEDEDNEDNDDDDEWDEEDDEFFNTD